MYVTVQEPSVELTIVNVHAEAENVPPFPPSLQETVPLGVEGVMLVSLTVAVYVTVPPVGADDEDGEMVVVVECRVTPVTLRNDRYVFAECPLLSPE